MTDTPLLLLHGALGSAAQFAPLLAQLPSGKQVFAPDFPGHGKHPAEGAFSMERFSGFIFDYLETHHLPSVDIFGYSMGGYAALFFAFKHPQKVRRIFTLGTKFDWNPETAERETALLDPEKISTKVPTFAEALALRHAPGDWKTVLHRTADLLRDLGAGNGLPAAAIAQITCPVTIGLGESDNMVTQEESRAVAGMLPDGRFEILSGCKHPIEQTDVVLLAKRLEEFFPAV